jgi:hypothetical protein
MSLLYKGDIPPVSRIRRFLEIKDEQSSTRRDYPHIRLVQLPWRRALAAQGHRALPDRHDRLAHRPRRPGGDGIERPVCRRFPDGSESVIVSGAGHASTIANRPIALVGSHVANGDRIVARAQSIGEIVVLEGEPVPGLLEPGYVPPAVGSAG